jgi:hypothetical protein
MTSGDGEWAAMSPPEGSVDIRLLDLVIDERWIVAMSKDLHDDLQAGPGADPAAFHALVEDVIFSARPVETTQSGQVGHPRYETTNVPTVFRQSDRVWIEGFNPDWPDRLWIGYPNDSVTSANAQGDDSDVP